jgi:hypothetical protein
MEQRKSRVNHTEPDELELKIIASFKNLKVASIAEVLDVSVGKVYSVLRKFQIPIKPHSNVEGTKYGKKNPNKRDKSGKRKTEKAERLTKPFKTNQLG